MKTPKAPAQSPAPASHPEARTTKTKVVDMIESITKAYDPDGAYLPKRVASFILGFFEALKKDEAEVETARFVEVNVFGAYRVKEIIGTAKVKAYIEGAEKKQEFSRKIVESGVKLRPESSFTREQRATLREIAKTPKFQKHLKENFDGSSTTGQTDPFKEFTPLTGGPFYHQMYLFDMLDGLAKAFEASNHNPLARQIINITTYFVLGRGVTFKAKSKIVQEKFAAWWKEEDMDERIEFWDKSLTRDGELLIRRFINPLTGKMFVRWVDPSTVWEIVTDLEDIERVFYYHQQFPTQYQVIYGSGPDKRFDATKFDTSKYVINQIPAEEICHVKINCAPNEKRGRSDLFPILGWLKRYKDFQTGIVLRAIIQSTFAWKMKLKGSDTDVNAFIAEFGTSQPEFGSVHVENESAELTPMTTDTPSQGPADCPGIVNAIAVGSGIPKEYLGFSEHSSRSTAVIASEPGTKKFQARQLLMGRLLKEIARYWYENEVAEGRIPEMSADAEGTLGPTESEIDFQFPEIAIEDRTAKMKDIEQAQLAGYISKRRAAGMSAKELNIENYNFDDEMAEIEDEKQTDVLSLFQPPPGAPPTPPEPGNPEPGEPIQPKKAGGLSSVEKRGNKRADRR